MSPSACSFLDQDILASRRLGQRPHLEAGVCTPFARHSRRFVDLDSLLPRPRRRACPPGGTTICDRGWSDPCVTAPAARPDCVCRRSPGGVCQAVLCCPECCAQRLGSEPSTVDSPRGWPRDFLSSVTEPIILSFQYFARTRAILPESTPHTPGTWRCFTHSFPSVRIARHHPFEHSSSAVALARASSEADGGRLPWSFLPFDACSGG